VESDASCRAIGLPNNWPLSSEALAQLQDKRDALSGSGGIVSSEQVMGHFKPLFRVFSRAAATLEHLVPWRMDLEAARNVWDSLAQPTYYITYFGLRDAHPPPPPTTAAAASGSAEPAAEPLTSVTTDAQELASQQASPPSLPPAKGSTIQHAVHRPTAHSKSGRGVAGGKR
jgi:hypothetical protein